MWPFKSKEKSDIDKMIEMFRQTRDQTDPGHRMQVYYCSMNCRQDGRVAVFPMLKTAPTPTCPSCGNLMTPVFHS